MKLKGPALILHCADEKSVSISALGESTSGTEIEIVDGVIDRIVDVSFEELNKMSASQIEQRMGRTIISLLENKVGVNLGVRDYRSIAERDLDQADTEITLRAQNGDMTAQLALATTTLETAISERSFKLLEDAESWYQQAAASGNTEAIEFLRDTWPALRNKYRKMFR